MRQFDRDAIRVVAFDISGTTVDWYTGVSDQVGAILAGAGVELDAPAFARAWRGRYVPPLRRPTLPATPAPDCRIR
jgi:2-haloacid dehalogenase